MTPEVDAALVEVRRALEWGRYLRAWPASVAFGLAARLRSACLAAARGRLPIAVVRDRARDFVDHTRTFGAPRKAVLRMRPGRAA